MKNLLLVDDSTVFQRTLEQRVLSGQKFEPYMAGSFEEAKKLIESGIRFFAAIDDLTLGDSAQGELVEYTLSKNIPTIVLSAQMNSELRSKIVRLPIVDYIVKHGTEEINQAVELAENLLFLKNRKVLIVDESRLGRMEMKLYLDTLLFDVYQAKNSAETLERIANVPDLSLVIISNTLKGEKGSELVRTIRKMYKEDIFIYGITSENRDDIKLDFLKSGANDCIVRPIFKEEFNARIVNSMKILEQREQIANYMETVDKYIITSETDTQGDITYASSAFSKISGFTSEELMGKNHRITRHPEMPDSFYEDLWNTISSGEVWEGEHKNLTKGGGFYWVRTHIDPIIDNDDDVVGYRAIRQDITDRKLVEEKSAQLALAQKNIMDSIRFASMIQNSILPDQEQIEKYLSDFFVIWEPKDIVGGDIYLFEPVESGFLLFVLDCTGHGVPGAFMTMVSKTALGSIVSGENHDNPAEILQRLNQAVRSTLGQDRENALSDNGLDGGILYVDMENYHVRYAGAKTPLYCIVDGQLRIYKGDRESIGYKRSDPEFVFQNHEISFDETLKIYLSTDGFYEQPGGEKRFRLGKRKFEALIRESHHQPMKEQAAVFETALQEYQGEEERMDDVTVFGLVLSKQAAGSFEVLSVRGEIDQEAFGNIIEQLEEHEAELKLKQFSSFKIIVTEVVQNMIKYAFKSHANHPEYEMQLNICYDAHKQKYFVRGGNVLQREQLETVKKRMDEVNGLDKEGLKALYRERRKSGEKSHNRGAGIGFLEMAKRSSEPLEYKSGNLDSQLAYLTLTVYE